MKFDIFAALKELSTVVDGRDHRVEARNNIDDSIAVRLSVYAKSDIHHNEFIINPEDLTDDNFLLFNLKFRLGLKQLNEHIRNYKGKD